MASTMLNIDGQSGFTLSEVLITIVIVGILSSIALPNFLTQIRRTRQNEAATTITQLQSTIISYADENGTYPTSWKDLNEVAAIMTPSGEKKAEDLIDNFNEVTLASSSCQKKTDENCYTYKVVKKGISVFELRATPKSLDNAYAVTACLDLISGYSDFRKEPSDTAIACEG